MKKCDSGVRKVLAKKFGLPPTVLKKTFDDYNLNLAAKTIDKFLKKVRLLIYLFIFHSRAILIEWSSFSQTILDDDSFHVAIMTPVLHYTMGWTRD